MVPKAVADLCVLLSNSDVQGATGEMMEIMYTPPEQLWHQQLFKE